MGSPLVSPRAFAKTTTDSSSQVILYSAAPNPGDSLCQSGFPTPAPSPSLTLLPGRVGEGVCLPNGENLADLIEVDAAGCWMWTGKTWQGYGRYYSGRLSFRAHRIVWAAFNGPTNEGLDHLCRTPLCVNPAHLEECHRAENVRRGNVAKINHAIAQEMRDLRRTTNMTYAEIGALYGVSRTPARNVCVGIAWGPPKEDRGLVKFYALPSA